MLLETEMHFKSKLLGIKDTYNNEAERNRQHIASLVLQLISLREKYETQDSSNTDDDDEVSASTAGSTQAPLRMDEITLCL